MKSAFPTQPWLIPKPDGSFLNLKEYGAEGESGMSLLQWYAGQALNALIATRVNEMGFSIIQRSKINAHIAIDHAEAMIAELEKRKLL